MILIPELETVLILVPRTGSGSLSRAVLAKYPRATLIYRHMEADGVPFGYDRWKKVGVVRHPVQRLWSLYKYLRDGGGKRTPTHVEKMCRSVQMSFNDWCVQNQTVFTDAHDGMKFNPRFSVHHALPENRKSQFLYLRPDLGTVIYRYSRVGELWDRLEVDRECDRHNVTVSETVPTLSDATFSHVEKVFKWDFEACGL